MRRLKQNSNHIALNCYITFMLFVSRTVSFVCDSVGHYLNTAHQICWPVIQSADQTKHPSLVDQLAVTVLLQTATVLSCFVLQYAHVSVNGNGRSLEGKKSEAARADKQCGPLPSIRKTTLNLNDRLVTGRVGSG